jgi:hypothetical protein
VCVCVGGGLMRHAARGRGGRGQAAHVTRGAPVNPSGCARAEPFRRKKKMSTAKVRAGPERGEEGRERRREEDVHRQGPGRARERRRGEREKVTTAKVDQSFSDQ